MERTIGKAVKSAVNGKPHDDQPEPVATDGLPEVCCGRCAHAEQRIQLGAISRVCIAHPPKLVPIPVQNAQGAGLQLTSLQPPVDEREKCGEFKRRPDG